MSGRSYSREEMEEILRRAAERTHAQEEAIRHEDLVAAAREVGIDETAIDSVVTELGDERGTNALVARHVASARARFWRRFSTFAIVSAFLGAIDLLTPGGPWIQWVLLVWGFALTLSARGAFLPPSSEEVDRLVEKDRKRREREAKREARRRAAEAWTSRWRELGEESARAAKERAARPSTGERLRSTEKQIDRAIEEGVTALVEALAKRALSAADAATRRPAAPAPARTDFDRYVQRQRSENAPVGPGSADVRPPVTKKQPGAVLVTPPPKTRVLAVEDEAESASGESIAETRRAPRRRPAR